MLGGGGSNILRGGKRSFECKTLVGNFVEETYRPGAVKDVRDGGANYTSNTRIQMQEGARIKVQEFGAGLRSVNDTSPYNYKELVGADKTRGSETTTRNEGATMRGEELQKHRERWTKESEALVKARYVTDASVSMDPVVKPQFRKELCKPVQPTFK
ncbi:hypothetical protein GQ600_4126 [Phytophthora cactorum]|nr:hypothetical protein GQ600_4126 [Phytophthora cactorum]